MSLSTVQIWQSLQDREIASAADCRQWASEILASAGKAALDDPQAILAQLVKFGHLTPFQANALLSRDNQPLTIGRHRLLAKLNTPALSDWFEAVDPSSNTTHWLYAISEERFKEPALDRHPPSLKLARQHASVRAAGLQKFSPPAFVDGYLLIAATPANGQSLREILNSYPRRALPAELSIKVMWNISRALAALHQEGIVHGRIGIDQVWWDGKDEVTLLRDPFFAPATPLGPETPIAVGVVDDQDYRVRYAAPEFTAPGQLPTFATDIYALGCLWWELMMGQLPFADAKIDQVPMAACKLPLTVPQEIGLSASQRKCLKHMLAKNPTSRFANGLQLVAALDVVCGKTRLSSPTAPLPEMPKLDSTPDKPTPVKPEVKLASTATPPTMEPASIKNDRHPRSPSPPAPLPEDGARGANAQVGASVPVLPPVQLVASVPSLPAVKPSDSPKAPAIPVAAKPVRSNVRRTIKKKARPVWFIPAMLGSCIALLGGLVSVLTWSDSGSATKNATIAKQESSDIHNPQTPSMAIETTTPSTTSTHTRVVDQIDDQFMISKGDDTLPWVPPRVSQPYSLAMLAPGAQCFIFVRPKAWLTTEVGKAVVQALEGSIDTLWKPIEKICGSSLELIEELTIGLYGGRSDGWPVIAYRVQLSTPTSVADLKQRLSNATEQTVGENRSILVVADQGILLSPATEAGESTNQTMAIGPVALIRELAEMDGGAPLRRQMEQLWQVSDARSDLSFLVNTGFFFSDARNVLPYISPRVESLCKELLDEKTQSLLITTSLEPNWYGELRVVGKSADDTSRFGKELQLRMKTIADTVESELVTTPASPYWRAIAGRFPQMLRALTRYQRFGIENGQAISNFYLPVAASANLTIATWMAIQIPAGATSVASTGSQPQVSKKLTGDDLLAYPISINFEQEPLDSALALLAEEVNRSLPEGTGPIALAIDGKSFELASVTRNQQIRDFRFKEQPLRALLTDLTARVNPDRTVKSLDEVKQAVVWILSEAEGKTSITFTTRRGIEGTDRKLPKEFVQPASP